MKFRIIYALLFSTTMTTFSQVLFTPVGPGGVKKNLTHWLKANKGTSTTVENAVVDTWRNQANPVLNATRAGGSNNAVYQSNVLNFNPVVNVINGDNGYFDLNLDVTTDSNYNVIAIVQRTEYNNYQNYIVGTRSSNRGQGLHFGYRNDNQMTIDHYGVSVGPSYVKTYDAGGVSVAMLRGQLSNAEGMTNEELRDGVFTSYTNPANKDYLKGSNSGVLGRGYANQGFVGYIAEVMIYNRSLNHLDLQKIYSYLAIKYGMTLDISDGITKGNYFINGGATLAWEAAAMAPYHNNVIGVVKDTKSALEQLKSKSEQPGDILTIDATATTSFDNLDYIVLGSDKGFLETTSVGKHPDYTSRTRRTWKVSSNNVGGGTIGNVDISIDIKGLIPDTGVFSDYALLVDSSDTDFSDASAYRFGTLTTNPATGVTTLNFTGVTLENNNVISLATKVAPSIIAPGGVASNMTHWLRADHGTSSTTDGDPLSQWDNIRLENHATRTITGLDDPSYVETRHNFNPSVYFPEGDNGYFDLNLEQIKGGSYNLITILERDNSNFKNYILGIQRATFERFNNNALHFGYRGNTTATMAQYGSDVDKATTAFNAPQTVALLRGNLDITKGKSIYELRNKQVTKRSDTRTQALQGIGLGVLGRGYGINGFEGYASEIIVYNDNLSIVDVTKIYSYLAVKYGLTLEKGTNYLASDNRIIWDAALNNDFYDNIGGIGRDDFSDLNQKQSISSNTNTLLTVALGDKIETKNIDNTYTFDDDLDFLIWGTRPTTTSFTTLCGLTTPKINRDWKIQNTGGVDKITLQFDMTGISDADKYVLLKDIDGDLSTTSDQTRINSGLFSSGNLTFSNISLADGIVFTLIRKVEYDIIYNGITWSGGSGAGNQPALTDAGKTVLVEENTTVTEDFNCMCINVQSGKVLTVPTDRVVNTNVLILNGDVYLDGLAELVQTTSPNINSGTGNVYKILGEAASSMYRYNYFSSPVNTFGNFSLKENLKLNTGATLADNISPVFTGSLDEPGEISRRWIHTFNNALAFTEVNEHEIMPAGVGFTMKGTASLNKYNFIGSPNNGDISVPLTKDNYLLTGNPYPSTIDAVAFNNLNGPSGRNVTEGVIYLWDQPSATEHYKAITDNSGGYATVTSTMAVGPATLEDGTTVVPGATIPTTFVKPGQGFIVYGQNTGNVFYNNTLRSGVNRTGNRFYKTKRLKKITPTIRLGFEYEHEDGRVYHRQIASALDGNTMKKDIGKDAFMFDYYNNDAYWILPNDEDRYIITSVPTVNDDLELPIGVVLDKDREITFKLDEVKSISKNIYLYDKAENKVVDITNKSHKVVVSAGEHTDRFSLVFRKQEELDTEYFDKEIKTKICITKTNIDISLENGNIKAVELYNFSGKKVLSYTELTNTNSLKVSTKGISTNMYVLKVITNSSSITEKIFIE